ncbi:MAG: hypothetical protein ACP5KS_04390 [Candidatus Hydrogenedens sp.]
MLVFITAIMTMGIMPDSYLLRTADALVHAQEDIPAMVQAGEIVAKRITAGGQTLCRWKSRIGK